METQVVVADFEEWREVANQAVELMRAGEVVALPTETVYGLGADATNAEAVAKIYQVKERPSFDPLIVHLGTRKDLSKYAVVSDEIKETVSALTEEFWPGPLTILLPKTDAIPDIVTSGLPNVAIRISAHEVMREVAKQVGAVAAPSANRFGKVSPTSAQAVMVELGGRIPLIIDGGACRDGLESTIIRIEPGEKKPVITVLRPGPVTREELRPFGVVKKLSKRSQASIEAPGQTGSHYAPSARLVILEKGASFIKEDGKRYGRLSYRGDDLVEEDWDACEILTPGNGKLSEAAVRFFYCLRKLDVAGVDLIVADAVSEVGIGVAIMDRLRRAAAGSGQ